MSKNKFHYITFAVGFKPILDENGEIVGKIDMDKYQPTLAAIYNGLGIPKELYEKGNNSSDPLST
jgi:hypothetical protein